MKSQYTYTDKTKCFINFFQFSDGFRKTFAIWNDHSILGIDQTMDTRCRWCIVFPILCKTYGPLFISLYMSRWSFSLSFLLLSAIWRAPISTSIKRNYNKLLSIKVRSRFLKIWKLIVRFHSSCPSRHVLAEGLYG